VNHLDITDSSFLGEVSIERLLFIFLMIALTNFIETTSYWSRLAGVRGQKIAISNSLYAMISFGSRTATLFFIAPIGGIIDRAVKGNFDPLHMLQFTLVGGVLGTALAIIFMPTIVKFYDIGVERLEKDGSIIRVFKFLILSKEGLSALKSCWTPPRFEMVKKLKLEGVPKSMVILNIVLYTFFSMGAIAAYYAAWLNPEYMARASSLSPAINAVGAFLLLFFVDAQSAIIVDRGLNRKIPMEVVRSAMVYLGISRFLGNILAIFTLYPAALGISFLTKFF